MPRRTRRRGVILIGLLGMLAAACAAPPAREADRSPSGLPRPGIEASVAAATPPLAPIRLKVPYTAISRSRWPVWKAQRAGFFANYGLDVELEYLVSGPPAMQSMLSGETGIVPTLAEPPVISAVL